jgi:hypothetical protein
MRTWETNSRYMKTILATTHGIVHGGFRGLRAFVPCKKVDVNYGFSLRDPARHHTIKRYVS